MNHSYRLVWSRVHGALVAVAEIAGAASPGSTPRRRGIRAASQPRAAIAGLAHALALLVAGVAPAALALPTGSDVVHGEATIRVNGHILSVDQATKKAIVNWQTFGIQPDESVNFHQPGLDSIILNRVIGADPSRIMGRLNANGQVFLINPNGVTFGRGAAVDVGGIVASTLDISNQDFLSGQYRFQGQTGAGVTNHGRISAHHGGSVAFIGPAVDNQGRITTRGGTTALGAGGRVTLTLAGNRLVHFQVKASALHAAAENGGLIEADDGGAVILSARARDAALYTVVNNTGVIRARGVAEHGGTITLLGGNEGTTEVAGALDASPGSQGAAAGTIETSGAHVEIKAASIDAGPGGHWLIDPVDLTIGATAANTINSTLSVGTSVTEQTSNGGASGSGSTASGPGDINVEAPLSWSTSAKLTLSAYRSLNIDEPITASGGGTLSLVYNNNAGGTSSGGTFNLGSGAAIDLASNAAFNLNGTDYTIITRLGNAGSTNGNDLQGISGNLSGDYVLGQNIDASATRNWNNGMGLKPIGISSNRFTGTFDGLGHSISKLTIDRPSLSDNGLFGITGGGSVIRNVGLVGASVTGSTSVGALVGRNYGTISNAYASGTISGNQHVGGLVGINYNGTISNAYATGAVSGSSSSSSNVGGLVGRNSSGTISNAYATGTVSGNQYVGGLVGRNGSGTISNAYATGAVSGSSNVGGLVGYNFFSTIRNVYAAGAVSGSSGVGGLLGYSAGDTRNAYWDTTTSGTSNGMGNGNDSHIQGLTTSDMMKLASFGDNFDISANGGNNTVWRIYNGHTYPLLHNFLTPLTVTPVGTGVTYNGNTHPGAGFTYTAANPDMTHIQGSFGSSETAVDTGSYTLSGSGLYSDQQGYDISSGANATLTIKPRAVAVSDALAQNKTYDGNTDATISGAVFAAASGNTGVISGDDLGLGDKTRGTFASIGAGTGIGVTTAATLTGTDKDNYTLTQQTTLSANISRRSVSVTGASAQNKTYDGNTDAAIQGATLSNTVQGDTVGLTNTARGTFDNMNAGTRKTVSTSFGLTGVDKDNYSLSQPIGLSATINPESLDATIIGNPTKTYDGNAQATLAPSNYALTGFVTGEGADVTQAAGQYNSKDVNSANSVIATLMSSDFSADSGTRLGNYTLPTQATGKGTITPAVLTARITGNPTRTYDGNTQAKLRPNGYDLDGLVSGESAHVTQTAGQYNSKDVNSANRVTATLASSDFSADSNTDLSNYKLPAQATGKGTIAPKGLAVTAATAQNKTYDGNTDAAIQGATLSNTVQGDTVGLTNTARGTFDNMNAGTRKTVSTSFGLTGVDKDNYSLSQPIGLSATINPESLDATIIGNPTKTYDGNAQATLAPSNYALTGFVTGEGADVTQAAGQYNSKDVNSANSVTATLASSDFSADSNTRLSNYTLPTQAVGSGHIQPGAGQAPGTRFVPEYASPTPTHPLGGAYPSALTAPLSKPGGPEDVVAGPEAAASHSKSSRSTTRLPDTSRGRRTLLHVPNLRVVDGGVNKGGR